MKIAFFITFSLVIFFVNAQEEVRELITDRPDQTESASTVPLKTLQIESGFIFESNQSPNEKYSTFHLNSTLMRYGLFERFEFRLGLAYLSEQIKNMDSGTEKSTKGLSPLYTGFKILVSDEKGYIPQIAFLGGLILPFTAGEEYKASKAAPVMRFAFSHSLSERISLGYNIGAEWNGEDAIPGYYYSMALGIAITEKLRAFTESFGLIYEQGGSGHSVDAGFTYLVLPHLQLDISGGLGLNENAGDGFMGFGVSYRIPH